MTRPSRRGRGAVSFAAPVTALVAAVVAALAAWNAWSQATTTDPIFAGDFVDPTTGLVVELQPQAPWIRPGSRGADELVDFTVLGDVDLVVRAGLLGFEGAIPPTSPTIEDIPMAVAEPFGEGIPVEFVVVPSNGTAPPDEGQPIVSPALEGAPVLVIAYADLDGDGFIGVTHLDGDITDHAIEFRELDAVGRQFAFFQNGQAAGEVRISVGSPRGDLRIALTAVAYVGPTRPDFFGGVVPEGPAVMTRMPFFPRTDPDRVIEGSHPPAADPDSLIGVELEEAFNPDPTADYGETFTLPTDGSEPSVDVATSRSGNVSHFGLARPADPALFHPGLSGPLRPGLDDEGRGNVLEILDPFALAAGAGAGGTTLLRLVPLDRLGNIAPLTDTRQVALVAAGGVHIVSPDLDGDPSQEVIQVSGPEGAAIEIAGAGSLVAEDVTQLEPVCGNGKLSGDASGDGIVDGADYTLWADNFGREGATFEQGDLNCDGIVDGGDYTIWADNLSAAASGGAGAAAESVPTCGLGGEIALLLWPLLARRHWCRPRRRASQER